MTSHLEKIFTNFSEAAGVEIQLLDQNHMSVRYVTLKKKRSIIEYVKGEYHLDSLEELPLKTRRLPVVVSITGKLIMNKILPVGSSEDPAHYLKKHLPGLSVDEFTLQLTVTDTYCVLSMVRNKILHPILEQIETLNVSVITLTIGPFALIPVWGHLPVSGSNDFIVDKHHFALKSEDKLSQYSFLEMPMAKPRIINFFDHEINDQITVAFANALGILASTNYPKVTSVFWDDKKRDYIRKTLFLNLSKVMLVFIASLFILHSIIYSFYSFKLEDIGYDKMEDLRTELNFLQGVLSDRNKNSVDLLALRAPYQGSIAFLTDQISNLVSDSITLDEIRFFPERHRMRTTAKFDFDFETIVLKGSVKEGSEFQRWLENIRQINGVNQVEINTFTVKSDGDYLFDIHILLNL